MRACCKLPSLPPPQPPKGCRDGAKESSQACRYPARGGRGGVEGLGSLAVAPRSEVSSLYQQACFTPDFSFFSCSTYLPSLGPFDWWTCTFQGGDHQTSSPQLRFTSDSSAVLTPTLVLLSDVWEELVFAASFLFGEHLDGKFQQTAESCSWCPNCSCFICRTFWLLGWKRGAGAPFVVLSIHVRYT